MRLCDHVAAAYVDSLDPLGERARSGDVFLWIPGPDAKCAQISTSRSTFGETHPRAGIRTRIARLCAAITSCSGAGACLAVSSLNWMILLPASYLHHRSAMGEFSLSSDAVIPTFKWARHIKELIPDEELKAFNAIGYTIGGMMVFPGNPIDGKWTINQARGCTKRIGDRFDLTLECIRRHYSEGESPLSGVLARYARFFDLFGDFRGYVEFFLLQDLVSADFSAVKISVPFDNFRGSPIPTDAHEYNAYKSASIAFIEARNQRILASAPLRSAQVCDSRLVPYKRPASLKL